jgi:CheY-like chemotaxis protein
VDRILAFSRSDDPELRPLRLYALCVEAVGLLRGSLPASVSIFLNASPQAECAAVFGDASRLQLVVLNLATNAAQAMDGRGELTLCLGTVETETASGLSHGVLPPGRYVQLAVTDTGQGIDPATAPRIFEPFFTTKEAGRGTGLGLATSWSIVADHGGTIHLRSRPGQGSTFEVWLPRTEAHLVDKEGEFSGPVPEGRGQTVLLVDDEQPLVLLGEEVLASLGYEPVGFSSAPKALAAFEADPARFDLALTDEVMPDMTGTHLAAALHRLRPELPVVLMTGFGGPVGAERLREAGIAEALRKPLARRTIAEALARHIKR